MRAKDSFAKKSLGQNFLIDQGVIDSVLSAFSPTENDIVLEIGPGRGALTELLVEKVRKLYALEFDRDLVPVLREKFGRHGNFELVQGDALKIDFRDLDRNNGKLRLIANLPYNISTAILQRLFSCADIFEDCVLMFQREVVERITARPGTSDRGFLTVLIEAHFAVERLFDVPPTAFRPEPRVWSSVVKLIPQPRIIPDAEGFRGLLAAGFAQKRKTILNNLRHKYQNAGHALESSGVDPTRRAETLTLDEWLALAGNMEAEPNIRR